MDLKNLVAISGKPGLFKLVSNRTNGLIVKDIQSEKTRFVSVRKHQFTPLDSVGIYTYNDTVDLSTVFSNIQLKEESNPFPNSKDVPERYFEYFEIVLPEFDRDRVFLSDIKKIIKWYSFIKKYGLANDGSGDQS